MAIFHCTVKIISRSSGRSAVGAAAYRSGERIVNESDQVVHVYEYREGIEDKEILLPSGAPAEYMNRSVLWNAVERAEKRKDAQTAREVEVALPVEFTAAERKEVLREYVQENFVSKGMIADICIHDKKDGNPHAHIMLTTRTVDEQGFGKKDRSWNDRDKIHEWRQSWADVCNSRLERHGERIDHRTLAAQGIERVPQIHIGAQAMAMVRKADEWNDKQKIIRVRDNRFIQDYNRGRFDGEFLVEMMNKYNEYDSRYVWQTESEVSRVEGMQEPEQPEELQTTEDKTPEPDDRQGSPAMDTEQRIESAVPGNINVAAYRKLKGELEQDRDEIYKKKDYLDELDVYLKATGWEEQNLWKSLRYEYDKVESGAVTYYGKLAENTAASGTASVDLPSGFVENRDILKVFVEEINGDNYTDFASAVIEITAFASQNAPSPSGGINEITGVAAGMEYSADGGSTWTAITETSVSNLAAGDYQVRVAGKVENKTAYTASDAVQVTVTDPVVSVAGITVTGGNTITTKGGTLQLAANITPENATNKAVAWTSNDTTIATVDAATGLVTAKADGSVIITATAQDGSNMSGTAKVAITGQTDQVNHDPINPPDPNVPIDLTKDAVHTFSGEFSNLARIQLNGKEMGQTNKTATSADLTYEGYNGIAGNVKAGSVVVTLYKEFLQTLPDGAYKLEAVFDDGGVESAGELKFTVKRDAQATPAPTATSPTTRNDNASPKTGDESNIGMYIALCIIAGVGIAGVLMWRRRKAKKSV